MTEPLRSSRTSGWKLFGYVSVTVLIMTVWFVLSDADLVNGLRTSIRATARSSFLLFLLTFVASSLAILIPAPLTSYLIRNRKFLGLSFAFSHLVHAIVIGLYAYFSEEYRSSFSTYDNASGFIGYGFIILMTLTSFKPTRRAVGETNWRILHTTGMWVFAYVFWKSNYELLSEGVIYVIFLNIMSAAMVVQLMGKVARRVRKKPSAKTVSSV
jgi:DMSO/TMAO reductase YedYZ heme-binding membrane subunit